MSSKYTYRGPLPLYISYFVLLALSGVLVALSFRLDTGSFIFFQLFFTGIFSAGVAFLLILYSTQIKRKLDSTSWRKNAETYYNDEGHFEYMPGGFTIITQGEKNMHIAWNSIIKIESREDKWDEYLRVSCIDLYFSDTNFITVDSTMAGFRLFERKLKENIRESQTRETGSPALNRPAARLL